MGSVFSLGLLFIVVGASGFTKRGLPFTAKRRLTGRRGRVVGSLCSAVGTLGIVFAFCFGSPVERQAMKLMSYGIAIGMLATILVLRGNLE